MKKKKIVTIYEKKNCNYKKKKCNYKKKILTRSYEVGTAEVWGSVPFPDYFFI